MSKPTGQSGIKKQDRVPSSKKSGLESEQKEKAEREEHLDKTIEDSFPASDPPSSIPDPDHEEDSAA